MTGAAALETNGLGKRYRTNWALQDCSFRIPTGRVAALVGPNGSGKSTLFAAGCRPHQSEFGTGENPRTSPR
jgi:ABC-type multidrug transport system ATPase subunit